MTGPVRSVRIDRLVVDGADLDAHDLARLPRLISAAFGDAAPAATEPPGPPDAGNLHDLAAVIARRTAAETPARGGRP